MRHQLRISRSIRGLGEIAALSGSVDHDDPIGNASMLSGNLGWLIIDEDRLNFAIVVRNAAHHSFVPH